MPAKGEYAYPLTFEQEAALRAAAETGRPSVGALARRWKIGSSTLHHIARNRLGLPVRNPQGRRIPWSDFEIEVLRRFAHCANSRIARKLSEMCGTTRAPRSIRLQRSRLGVLEPKPDGGDAYSVDMIAAGLGEKPGTVYRWTEKGWLPSKKRGGRVWIGASALRDFLLDINCPVQWNVAKVDHDFFLDLMRGAKAARIVHSVGRGDSGSYSVALEGYA